MTFVLTQEVVSRVLATVDKGLSNGLGQPTPGNMCVEAAVCYALGLPHGDDPPCVDEVIRAFKIKLNDSDWGSNKSRAKGMRRLAVLQLGTKDNFDRVYFAEQLALKTIKVILPIALSKAGLDDHAKTCANVLTLSQAQDAAYYAARAAGAAEVYVRTARTATAADYAFFAARAASAARAADYSAYTARTAAEASARTARTAAATAARGAARDKILSVASKIAEDILIDMKVPAVSFLSLTE